MSRTTTSLVLVLLFVAPMLSGCFGSDVIGGGSDDSDHWLPPVEDREQMTYENGDVFSRVSNNGSYGIDTVPVSYTHLRAHET